MFFGTRKPFAYHIFRLSNKQFLMQRLPIIIILLTCIFTLAIAQEESLGTRFPEGVQEAEYRYRTAEGAEQVQSRIDPPFWWVGMAEPRLQLMVHRKDIGQCKDWKLQEYAGVRLQQVHHVANPNYLFIDLWIGPGTPAGRLTLTSDCGKAQRIEYELRQRQSGSDRVQGINSSDLIYLIMPDRFANGNTDNDSPPGMRQQGIDRENVFFRHGGDLIGIMEHLDYLQELGVTALWLNPVLENDQPYESYHGYAVTDHYRIDPRFGTNEQYLQLVNLCHERGIKVIMDIIHNHVGDQHHTIRDLPTEDWIHQSDTFFKTTYRATTLMDPYAAETDRTRMLDGWFDNHMPDLNQRNPLVANYLTQNNIWWVEYSGQDGYRIDTYAYNDQDFMANWGQRMQREFPSLGFFGETWVHGPAVQAQFTADNQLREGWNSHLPGVTDFQLYYAITEALNQTQGWTSGIARLYYTLAQDFLYDDPYRNVLFLDNHDLARLFSALDQDLDKFKSGITMLMTLRGIPMIYYGTELAMTGVGGAFGEAGRRDFPGGWSNDAENKFKKKGRTELEQEVFGHIKTLANYRKNNPVLHTGKLTQFVPENDIYAYFRHNENKTVAVFYNSAEEPQTFTTERYSDRLAGFGQARNIATGEAVQDLGTITLEAKSCVVWELSNNK